MSTALFDLRGRVALITGSNRGLGLVLARGLAEAGARPVLNGRDRQRLDVALGELRGEGHDAHAFAFDVTAPEAVREAVERIEAEVGSIEILVNNAGIQARAPLLEVELEAWRAMLDTNLTSAFLAGQAVARRMLERGRGKIINICSLQSEVARPGIAPYTAAKGALKMLTKGMCADWGPYGIQVNAIGPGYFVTDLTRGLREDAVFDEWVRRRTPAGRWGDPSELIGAAVFLASPASDFVNGQIVYVDGGMLAVL
jgi:gluconate 5-dehydrogenase